jgi:hypothetical protein
MATVALSFGAISVGDIPRLTVAKGVRTAPGIKLASGTSKRWYSNTTFPTYIDPEEQPVTVFFHVRLAFV